MLSAPPVAAAKQATVPRRMFTHGSRRAVHAGRPSPHGRASAASQARHPPSASTPPQSRRRARSLATPVKRSASMASAKAIWPAASVERQPRPPPAPADRPRRSRARPPAPGPGVAPAACHRRPSARSAVASGHTASTSRASSAAMARPASGSGPPAPQRRPDRIGVQRQPHRAAVVSHGLSASASARAAASAKWRSRLQRQRRHVQMNAGQRLLQLGQVQDHRSTLGRAVPPGQVQRGGTALQAPPA